MRSKSVQYAELSIGLSAPFTLLGFIVLPCTTSLQDVSFQSLELFHVGNLRRSIVARHITHIFDCKMHHLCRGFSVNGNSLESNYDKRALIIKMLMHAFQRVSLRRQFGRVQLLVW